MRVLIAPDDFKGTLSAVEAAEAIAIGWRSHAPDDTLTLIPMSDGGPGFVLPDEGGLARRRSGIGRAFYPHLRLGPVQTDRHLFQNIQMILDIFEATVLGEDLEHGFDFRFGGPHGAILGRIR